MANGGANEYITCERLSLKSFLDKCWELTWRTHKVCLFKKTIQLKLDGAIKCQCLALWQPLKIGTFTVDIYRKQKHLLKKRRISNTDSKHSIIWWTQCWTGDHGGCSVAHKGLRCVLERFPPPFYADELPAFLSALRRRKALMRVFYVPDKHTQRLRNM